MILFGDFETRAVYAPADVGLVNYMLHPRTLPLMFAYGNLNEQRQWVLPLPYAYDYAPACPPDLIAMANDPSVMFHAHNAAFEIACWNLICVERWGWPRIPLERWFCTAAKGRAAGQPGGLDKVTKRLRLGDDAKKDARGKELIELLSTPTKCEQTYLKIAKGPDGKSLKEHAGYTKAGKEKFRVIKYKNPLSEQYLNENGIETFEVIDPETGDVKQGKDGKVFKYFFNEDPELMEEYRAYNIQDIVAEAHAHQNLPEETPMNRATWLLDRKVNSRGIPIDMDLCRGAMEVYAVESVAYDEELKSLTDDFIDKPTQSARIVEWLNRYLDWKSMHPSKPSPKTGKIGDGSLAQPIIPDFLALYQKREHAWLELPWCIPEEDVPAIMPRVLRVLEIRDIAGGTATSKYNAALNWANPDNRAREQVLVFGAATGRWTGKGIQPHNMARVPTLDETFIDAIKTGSHELVELMGQVEGMTVIEVLKGAIRGLVCAPEGRKLVVSDFAGIESRVLNWLCGNEYKLDLFRRKEDTYIHAAVPIYFTAPPGTAEYNAAFESITEWSEKKQKIVIQKAHSAKRQIGKGCELGLGYGMGARTFRVNAIKEGNEMTEDFAEEVVKKWRAASPQIPEFWYALEDACRAVIKNERDRQKYQHNPPKRLVKEVCKIKIGWHPRGYLCLKLPSGRFLYYYGATIAKDRAPNALDDKSKIFYWDATKTGHPANKGKISTYSGKLVENVVQAVARDLLDFSMKLIDQAGLKIIFSVHDEAVVETHEDDDRAFDIVHAAMETLPPWAEGLPLEAESYQARRYTK